MPPILAVGGATHAALDAIIITRCQGLLPRSDGSGAVVRMKGGGPAKCLNLAGRLAGVLVPIAVSAELPARSIGAPDQVRNGVGDKAGLLLALAQGVLGAAVAEELAGLCGD